VGLSSCSTLGEQDLDRPSMEERIDDLFTRYADSCEFSGAVLVAGDDQVLIRRGYGLANREEQVLNTPDTQFLIQSVAKLFTYVLS